jgi:hypothetical protein
MYWYLLKNISYAITGRKATNPGIKKDKTENPVDKASFIFSLSK